LAGGWDRAVVVVEGGGSDALYGGDVLDNAIAVVTARFTLLPL
jgi:outer membrane receptor protein involved in Fe transport